MTVLPATTVGLAHSDFHSTKPYQVLRAESALNAPAAAALRRKLVLNGCKWDPQVGDVDTLAPFPLVMSSGAWRRVARQAEQLAEETLAAEEEILRTPELLNQLGLPRRLRTVLAGDSPLTPAAARVMRFDFHWTTEGWRISEVNSDVPGGFSEASLFTSMMAEHYPKLRPAGNPAADLGRALLGTAGPDGVLALMSAPGYMEDHQVIAFLAAQLQELGRRACLAKPEQISWRDGVAHLNTAWHQGPVNAVVRFYQAEWLSCLPERTGWRFFLRGGRTLVTNPAPAIISESKRFPLVWDQLATPLPTWRALLPETRDPRAVPWSAHDEWLLKTSMCNTGDAVHIRELMPQGKWLQARIAARLAPARWLAQRRFPSAQVQTPAGPRHVCVGVYTINGRASGAYARMSERAVIDFQATDVALLLDDDE